MVINHFCSFLSFFFPLSASANLDDTSHLRIVAIWSVQRDKELDYILSVSLMLQNHYFAN